MTTRNRSSDLAREVAVLCCAGRSQYKYEAGVLAFDAKRDARTFTGGIPVIAHPPCRCWSKYLSKQAKPSDMAGEMALGLWCVDQVIRHGGILEHPAHSRLWQAAGLPQPGDMADVFLYTIYVEQAWFGFGFRKATWLLISGIPRHTLPEIPFRIRGNYLSMSKSHREQNSRTVPAFARWLLAASRLTWHSLPVRHYAGRNGISAGNGIEARPGEMAENTPCQDKATSNKVPHIETGSEKN